MVGFKDYADLVSIPYRNIRNEEEEEEVKPKKVSIPYRNIRNRPL